MMATSPWPALRRSSFPTRSSCAFVSPGSGSPKALRSLPARRSSSRLCSRRMNSCHPMPFMHPSAPVGLPHLPRRSSWEITSKVLCVPLSRKGAIGLFPAPQEDDPVRCEAQLDPLGAAPTFLPAGVVADLWVEPEAGTLRLEHPFVGGEVLRVVRRRSLRAAVDGVARAERLHRRGARPEGACDPLVASVLLHPTVDVVYELPERHPLIYTHASPPLFNCTRVLEYI